MKTLLKKFDVKWAGIFAFLLFFVFTPLLLKVRVWDGVYVEPLIVFLILGLFLIAFGFWKKGSLSNFFGKVARLILPNRLAVFYFLLIAALLASFVYGYFLTGVFSLDDLLHLAKFALYFLPFPLAIYAGKFLGLRGVDRVLSAVVVVGAITAIVSISRVIFVILSSGEIDFWVNSIYSHSVGFLGQFVDPRNWTVGLTGKAAHATYGLYASVVLAVCLGLASKAKEFTGRWFTYLAVAGTIFLGGILYTLSRGVYVTAALVILGWLVWVLQSKKVRAVIFSLSFLVLSSLVLIWMNPAVYQKLSSTVQVSPEGSATGSSVEVPGELEIDLDPSTLGRIERWKSIFETFREHPAFALFGLGYNLPNLVNLAGVHETHSFFLDMWVRGGLPALLLAIVVWFYLFKLVLGFAFSKNREVQVFGFPLFGFVLGWFIDNFLSGEQFFSDAPMIAFWGTAGLVYAMQHTPKEGIKKILITLTSSGPGGAPKVVYDLLSQVRRTRSEIATPASRDKKLEERFDFVVAAPIGGAFNREFRKLGYRVYPVPFDKIGIRGFTELYRIARKEDVDLINAHGKGAGLCARMVGPLLGIPVVQTFHGLHYDYRNRLVRFLYLALEKWLVRFTTLFINVSVDQQREGLAMKLFPRSKSRVVVNGVDTGFVDRVRVQKAAFRTKLGLGPRDFVVTLAGRFDPVKGHQRLVEMVSDLINAVPHLKILLVGDGELRRSTERLAKELKVIGAMRFLGWRPDVLKIFKASDAAILPSFHEGMPLTVLEAMACRLPVVGSDVVGIRELIENGKSGYLVDLTRGSGELKKALLKLSRNRELRRRMGEQGRRIVEGKFSVDKFAENTLKVYKEALA